MAGDSPETTVDVAIVNWNTSAAAVGAARACAASAGVAARVTVVDNASSPEQRRLLEGDLPAGARLDPTDENLGYGKAANRALAGGAGELVCVSNADVVPSPGALAELAAVALAEPRSGIVGPSFEGGSARYHAQLPTPPALLGQSFAGSFMRRTVADPPEGAVIEAGQPSGAFFVMRRAAWQQLGGFDEGFFLWYEDVDLARRALDLGLRNLIAGSARARHAKAEAFVQLDPRRAQAIRLASLRRYVGKHHPRLLPLAAPLLALSGKLRA